MFYSQPWHARDFFQFCHFNITYNLQKAAVDIWHNAHAKNLWNWTATCNLLVVLRSFKILVGLTPRRDSYFGRSWGNIRSIRITFFLSYNVVGRRPKLGLLKLCWNKNNVWRFDHRTCLPVKKRDLGPIQLSHDLFHQFFLSVFTSLNFWSD